MRVALRERARNARQGVWMNRSFAPTVSLVGLIGLEFIAGCTWAQPKNIALDAAGGSPGTGGGVGGAAIPAPVPAVRVLPSTPLRQRRRWTPTAAPHEIPPCASLPICCWFSIGRGRWRKILGPATTARLQRPVRQNGIRPRRLSIPLSLARRRRFVGASSFFRATGTTAWSIRACKSAPASTPSRRSLPRSRSETFRKHAHDAGDDARG